MIAGDHSHPSWKHGTPRELMIKFIQNIWLIKVWLIHTTYNSTQKWLVCLSDCDFAWYHNKKKQVWRCPPDPEFDSVCFAGQESSRMLVESPCFGSIPYLGLQCPLATAKSSWRHVQPYLISRGYSPWLISLVDSTTAIVGSNSPISGLDTPCSTEDTLRESSKEV